MEMIYLATVEYISKDKYVRNEYHDDQARSENQNAWFSTFFSSITVLNYLHISKTINYKNKLSPQNQILGIAKRNYVSYRIFSIL